MSDRLPWEDLERSMSGSLDLDEETRAKIIHKLRKSHAKHRVRTNLLLCVHFARNDYQIIASRKEYRRAFSEYVQHEHKKLSIESLSLEIFDDGETAYQLFHRYLIFLRSLGYVSYITKRDVTAIRGPPKRFWARVGYALTKQETLHLVEYNLIVDYALTQEAHTELIVKENLKKVLSSRETPVVPVIKASSSSSSSNSSSAEDIVLKDETFTITT